MASNIKINKIHTFTGTGAPADGDQLVLNDSQHPVGSIYVDDSGIVYNRTQANKVAADWASSSGSSSYLVYTALLSQLEIGNPSQDAKGNTIGVVGWIRDNVGSYYTTTTTDWNPDSVWIGGMVFGENAVRAFPIFNANGTLYAMIRIIIYEEAGSKLGLDLRVNDGSGNAIDISDLVDRLSLPEIRVYP